MNKPKHRTVLRDLDTTGETLTPDELRTAAGGIRVEQGTYDEATKQCRVDSVEEWRWLARN